jgi:hypothetical protein
MKRKKFFEERSVAEIRSLYLQRAHTQRDLVRKIKNLNPDSDSIVIQSRLTPGKYFRGGVDSELASKRNIIRGRYIKLKIPKSLTEAIENPRIPLDYREEFMEQAFKGRKEEEIDFVGFSWNPFFGKTLKTKQVPFYGGPEGARIIAHSQISRDLPGIVGENAGIEIVPYTNTPRVSKEGGKITLKIPSRTEGHQKYEMKFTNVPLVEATDRFNNPRALIWNLERNYVIWPKDAFWRFAYTPGKNPETSDRDIFIPQDIAAYVSLANYEQKQNHNLVPMVVNPFPLPSKKQAEFYMKLKNNVLIFDPKLSSKHHLRKLHLDEIAILLARQAFVEGHNETMYWDWGIEKGGRFRDYDWRK